MRFILAVAATAMLSSAAFAADAIVYQEPAAVVVAEPTFSWSGVYVGAHAGYGWGKTEDVYNPAAPEKKLHGGFGGLQAGYNWQFDNNVVLGAEADVSFGSIKRNWYDTAQYSTYYTKDKIGTHGTVRARLGYAADRFLPYVTGGLAWADLKHSVGCSDKNGLDPILFPAGSTSCRSGTARPNFENSSSKVSVGYSIGAGVEYAVTNNWTLKTEYLYSNYGKKTVTITDPNFPAASGERRFKTDVSEIRVGVNYKF